MTHKARWIPFLACMALSAAPLAQAATKEDPWEGFNRAIFSFNDTLDTYALKPLAEGYQKVTPQPVEDSVSHFFANIGDVRNLINDLLQGKFHAAGVDTSRLLFNTTFGVFGLFDVATPMGLQRNDEDFGQTLGAWGLNSGPYLVLPFFGPSTVRDTAGRLPDMFTDVYPYMNDISARNIVYGVDTVQNRADLLAVDKMVRGDRYNFIRNAYLQNREFKVKDGEVVDDF